MEGFAWREHSNVNLENDHPNITNVTIRSKDEDLEYSFCGESRGTFGLIL
jgi:hypothetical protein